MIKICAGDVTQLSYKNIRDIFDALEPDDDFLNIIKKRCANEKIDPLLDALKDYTWHYVLNILNASPDAQAVYDDVTQKANATIKISMLGHDDGSGILSALHYGIDPQLMSELESYNIIAKKEPTPMRGHKRADAIEDIIAKTSLSKSFKKWVDETYAPSMVEDLEEYLEEYRAAFIRQHAYEKSEITTRGLGAAGRIRAIFEQNSLPPKDANTLLGYLKEDVASTLKNNPYFANHSWQLESAVER